MIYNKEAVDEIYSNFFIYFFESASFVIAEKVLEEIKASSIYNDIISDLPPKKVDLFFLRTIELSIRPYLKEVLIPWFLLRDKELLLRIDNVFIPNEHIFKIIKELITQNNVILSEKLFYRIIGQSKQILEKIKRSTDKFLIKKFWYTPYDQNNLNGNAPKIAVHLAEGINLRKKSDIAWFPNSGISPENVLLYIDNAFYDYIHQDKKLIFNPKDKDAARPISQALNDLGFKWVLVGRGFSLSYVERNRKDILCRQNIRKKKLSLLDKWVLVKMEELTIEIDFWRRFYQAFNIKLDFLPEEGDPLSIAKNMALESLEKGGLTFGRQRSDAGEASNIYTGFHTKDIFFAWNKRTIRFLKPPYNEVKAQIITGHPNDLNFYKKEKELINIQNSLRERGSEFIIALFDTGALHPQSKEFICKFYKAFIEWLLNDSSVGIVVKSKKSYIIKSITELHPLLEKAFATGRYHRFDQEYVRLPSDASRIADFAVGAGLVNSALTEGIIAGCRGLFYHPYFPKSHEYYKWGYETLVFTNLDKMVKALKAYKYNPASNPGIGDWTPYLDLLDPYRDGRAGERMGTYLRWCLEGFDAGMNRDNVIKRANEKYADQWGNDKVIQISE